MIENTATVTRAAIEALMSTLSEDDDVYSALVGCQQRLSMIAWNRFADHHERLARNKTRAKRRASFVRRHKGAIR